MHDWFENELNIMNGTFDMIDERLDKQVNAGHTVEYSDVVSFVIYPKLLTYNEI